MKKEIAFIFRYLFLDTFGVAFNKGLPFNFYILVFQYFIKRKTTFKILNIFYYYFIILHFFQVHNLLSQRLSHKFLLKSLIVNYHRYFKINEFN